MSFARRLARNTEAPRRVNDRQKYHRVFNALLGKWEEQQLPYHKAAHQWWRGRLADLVERRQDDGTYEPRSKRERGRRATPPKAPPAEMLPRPRGMSRQVHRRLYRLACRAAGADWRGYGRAEIEDTDAVV